MIERRIVDVEARPLYWYFNRPPNPLEALGGTLADVVAAVVVARGAVRKCSLCGAAVVPPYDFHVCPVSMFTKLWRPE
jgi:hypothetical protein